MKKNSPVNSDKESSYVTIGEPREYKIGRTTYIVTTKFNVNGESLEDIILRMIKRDIDREMQSKWNK